MRHSTHSQRGFALVEVALVIVIVGIIAFVAWRIIQASGDVQTVQNQAPQTSTTLTIQVPALNTTSDLDKLQGQLDTTQIDDSTSTDLDTQTTF